MSATTATAIMTEKKKIIRVSRTPEQIARANAKVAAMEAKAAAKAAAEAEAAAKEFKGLCPLIQADIIKRGTAFQAKPKKQGLIYRYLIDLCNIYTTSKKITGTGCGSHLHPLIPHGEPQGIIISGMGKNGMQTFNQLKGVKIWGQKYRQMNDPHRNRHFDIFLMKKIKAGTCKKGTDDLNKPHTQEERNSMKQYFDELGTYLRHSVGCLPSKIDEMIYNERVKYILHHPYELTTSENWKKITNKYEAKERSAKRFQEEAEAKARAEARRTIKSNGKNAPNTKEKKKERADYVEDIITKLMNEANAADEEA